MGSLDFVARRTLMSAVLYYGLDTPMLTDKEFDEGCKRLIKEWKDIHPLRQWQLGSKDELATTGYHIKATRLTVSAAQSWAMLTYPIMPGGVWRWSAKHQVHWLPAGQFYAGEPFA